MLCLNLDLNSVPVSGARVLLLVTGGFCRLSSSWHSHACICLSYITAKSGVEVYDVGCIRTQYVYCDTKFITALERLSSYDGRGVWWIVCPSLWKACYVPTKQRPVMLHHTALLVARRLVVTPAVLPNPKWSKILLMICLAFSCFSRLHWTD